MPAMPSRLTVLTGPMFSAKSGELMNYIVRARLAGKRLLVMKPARDTRTSTIAARSVGTNGTASFDRELPAHSVASEEEFWSLARSHAFEVLAVDEAQFFPLDTPMKDSLGWFGRAIRTLLEERRDTETRIIVAGLDTDAFGEPFGPMPGLLALANEVRKLTAVCTRCGSDDAHLTERLSGGSAQIQVGDMEYTARCRACFGAGRAIA